MIKSRLEKKYFFVTFAAISIMIGILLGFDLIGRMDVKYNGIKVYSEDEYECVKFEESIESVKVENVLYGVSMQLEQVIYDDYQEANLVLQEIIPTNESFRFHFVCQGVSDYERADIFNLDKFEGTEVYTNVGSFYLKFVYKEEDGIDRYSYYYDIVSLEDGNEQKVVDIKQMEFTLANVYEYVYFRKIFELSALELIFIMCGVAALCVISGAKGLVRNEWVTNYSIEYLEFEPDVEDKGHYIKKYTLAGATIKSMAFGAVVSLILYLLYHMGLFLCGYDRELIAICGVTTTLLRFRSMKDDIIREIEIDG